MPVVFVCPHCAAVVERDRLPILSCSKCGQPLPVDLQRAAAAGLAKSRVQRPLLLNIGMVGSFFLGGLMLLFLPLAPFDIGTYTINGTTVSGPEFLRRFGIVWGAVSALYLAIGYGLMREKPWARPLMMLYWVGGAALLFAAGGASSEAGCSAALLLFPAGAAAWYLYEKDSVVEYYDALLDAERAKPSVTSQTE
jgi:hypothetical protein